MDVILGKLTKFFHVHSNPRLEEPLVEVISLGGYTLLLTSPTVTEPLIFSTMSLYKKAVIVAIVANPRVNGRLLKHCIYLREYEGVDCIN